MQFLTEIFYDFNTHQVTKLHYECVEFENNSKFENIR